jgi:hypothetical protein
VPKLDFNLDNEAELKKKADALKDFQRSISETSDKIKVSLAGVTLPKATAQALALNLQIDQFVKKAADAGVNTAKFSGQVAGLRDRIEELRQTGLQKEALAFSEQVDSAAVAVDRLSRGGLPVLEEKLGNVEDSFKSLRDKIQNDIDANAALADTNETAARAMERLKQILAGLGEAHDKATRAAIAQVAAEQQLADLATQRNNFDTSTAIADLRQARGDGGPVSSAQADLQNAARQLGAQTIETASKLKELEIERAQLVEQNQAGANDQQIANLDSEIALQAELHDLVMSTSADQLVAARKVDEAFTNFADDLSSQLADML